MKKILFILENMEGGGAEKVLVDILQNFDYNVYDVTLLLLRQKGVYLKRIPNSVHILSIFDDTYSLLFRLFRKYRMNKLTYLYQQFLLKRQISNLRFFAIISFMEGYSVILHSYIMKLAIRNITWIHTDLKKNNWCLSYFNSFEQERTIYEKMDDIVFVSEAARQAFRDLFKINRGIVVYNLIDCLQIQKLAREKNIVKEKFTVCNVGRLICQKRQDRIIKVASIVRSKGYDMEFWILGTGPIESSLRKAAKENCVENIVLFKGFKENPYPYIFSADVFLLTSESEGLPLVVAEALCLGKPIVSTRVTGPEELLAGGSGILCDENVNEIAEKLIEIYNSRTLLDYYAEKARIRSLVFDKNKTMQRIYDVIECRFR